MMLPPKKERKKRIFGWICPKCGSLNSIETMPCPQDHCDFLATGAELAEIAKQDPYKILTEEEQKEWGRTHRIKKWAVMEY